MGKHKHDDDSVPQPSQAQVDEALQPHAELPPQSSELKLAQALLGQPVRALVGAHMTTVFLTDVEGDSYHGLAVRCRSFDAKDFVPDFEAVHGLRRYPTLDRPNYAFQFVLPGEDEAPLVNIANRYLQAHAQTAPLDDPGSGTVSEGNQ